MSTHTSRADVPTDSAGRYAKQLVTHLGRKIPFTEEGDAAWSAPLGDATARVVVGDGVLTLQAEAPDTEALARVEHVLGSHLERFGQRAELAVAWQRSAA